MCRGSFPLEPLLLLTLVHRQQEMRYKIHVYLQSANMKPSEKLWTIYCRICFCKKLHNNRLILQYTNASCCDLVISIPWPKIMTNNYFEHTLQLSSKWLKGASLSHSQCTGITHNFFFLNSQMKCLNEGAFLQYSKCNLNQAAGMFCIRDGKLVCLMKIITLHLFI